MLQGACTDRRFPGSLPHWKPLAMSSPMAPAARLTERAPEMLKQLIFRSLDNCGVLQWYSWTALMRSSNEPELQKNQWMGCWETLSPALARAAHSPTEGVRGNMWESYIAHTCSEGFGELFAQTWTILMSGCQCVQWQSPIQASPATPFTPSSSKRAEPLTSYR